MRRRNRTGRNPQLLNTDAIPGKLEELEQYDVSMIDHGDVLENEEGVVVSEIQGTYY